MLAREKKHREQRSFVIIFFEKYKAIHPDEEIVTISVFDEKYTPFTNEILEKRSALTAAKSWQDPMFDAANIFKKADKIVIGAPYWDLSFPAALKCFIEHIYVSGLTFEYIEKGVASLCKASKTLYISMAGGPMSHANHGYTYIESLFSSMFGVKEISNIKAEFLDVIGQDIEKILSKACADIDEMVEGF